MTKSLATASGTTDRLHRGRAPPNSSWQTLRRMATTPRMLRLGRRLLAARLFFLPDGQREADSCLSIDSDVQVGK